ncbi:glyoxalase/bleomycin resistance protein/dioxygenase superfamily protein [Paenibacillus taihuensis]|uniref:Glyoxalase/bleomycin resistance protein/dioxygenase superfamily protein n=1 Tax=Paenibacillus taihuensis TaxID=1156355 RepID=A0A3D9S8F5_9BACL|nr:VOC family protein [Paenibacillus taihuensis]REE89005.1 glyoxalase/bleomycin resistance protein/dioxygenase superfamily protein [Paenibacillus taihuensis]
MADQVHVKQQVVKDFTLEIPVKDIQQSAEWYVNYLGFELVEPVLGIAELRLGSGCRICLFQPDHTDETSYWYVKDRDNYRVRVCLRVPDLEQLHSRLSEAGVNVSPIEGDIGCGWAFHFHDINRNKLVAWGGYTKEHVWFYE